jgi:hypothetical protein
MAAFIWDFVNKHVNNDDLTDTETGKRGNYISSESIVLAAGPSTYTKATTGGLNIVPIGVCDAIQVMQNKGVVQLYEIGSRIPYIIPGRPTIQFQISRVLFNGDSLLGALSQRNESSADDYSSNVLGKPGTETTGAGTDNPGKFYMNLASHFFNAPTGLAIFFKDSEKEWVGAYYAENCIIQQHSMAIQGQNMVVMENASIRCTSFVPMEASAFV